MFPFVGNMLYHASSPSSTLPCISFCVLYCALYLLFLPPLVCPIDSGTAAADVVEYDYFVDDRTTTVELSGKQSPFPLPHIAYLSVLILALGIAAAARYTYSFA